MRENWRWDTVKDQVHMIHRSEERGDYSHLVVGGPLGKPGQRYGSPITHHGRFICQPSTGTDALVRAGLGQPNQRQPVTVEVLPKSWTKKSPS